MGLLAKYGFALLLIILNLRSFVLAEELLVISNKSIKIELTRQQLKQLYLGARLTQQDISLQPLMLPVGSHWRAVFNTKVVGLSEARIQSYWAQMKFTGRRTPPLEVGTITELLNEIKQTPGKLGYAPKSQVNLNEFNIIYQVLE